MKAILLLPLVLFSACVSRSPQPVLTRPAPAPVGRPVDADALRIPEQVHEYRFGRYVDPADPLVLHESHPVYRIETSARWNLRPGSNRLPVTRAASAPTVSANDAVLAEINKQRPATQAFTEQSTLLSQKLQELSKAVGQTQELAKQGLALKQDVTALTAKVETLSADVARLRTPAPQQTPAATEDKW